MGRCHNFSQVLLFVFQKIFLTQKSRNIVDWYYGVQVIRCLPRNIHTCVLFVCYHTDWNVVFVLDRRIQKYRKPSRFWWILKGEARRDLDFFLLPEAFFCANLPLIPHQFSLSSLSFHAPPPPSHIISGQFPWSTLTFHTHEPFWGILSNGSGGLFLCKPPPSIPDFFDFMCLLKVDSCFYIKPHVIGIVVFYMTQTKGSPNPNFWSQFGFDFGGIRTQEWNGKLAAGLSK